MKDGEPKGWLGRTVVFEGVPMALRVQPAADTPENRARFQRLAVITHALDHVRSDGLPEAAYNEGLAELDASIVEVLEKDHEGVVCLIETIAGERSYYAYVGTREHGEAAMAAVAARFPEPRLSLGGSFDPQWGLLNEYRERFPW